MASTLAETMLRGKLACSHCYRVFERSNILWCRQCNHNFFCYTCGDEHVETTEHDVGELCEKHTCLQTRYCKTCRRLICDVCGSCRHSRQGHDVVDYRDVIAETLTDLEKHIHEIGKTQFTALVEQITQVGEFRDEMKKKPLCDVIEEVHGTDSGLIDTEIRNMEEKIVDYQQQIENFREDIEDAQQQIEQLRQNIEDAQRRKMKTDREFQKKTFLLDQLEKDFGTNLRHIEAALTEMKATEEQLRTFLGMASLTAKEMLLAPNILKDIKKTRHALDELVVAAEQDKISPLKEMARKAPGSWITEEYIRSAGLFSNATLSHEMEVQEKGFGALGVVFMSESVLALCGGTDRRSDGVIGFPFKLLLLDIISNKETVILDGNTALADIKKLNEDEVVVLCWEDPILRVINVHTRVIRNISVNLSKKKTGRLWQLEVDESGRFVVLYGEQIPKKHLVLIDGDGTVLQDTDVGDVAAFTLCRLTNIVFTCSFRSDMITSYHVHENRFTEIASVPQGVEGLRCWDICSGVLGDVYVIGKVPADQHIKVYQLLELVEDNKMTGLRALGEFADPWRFYNVFRCSVFNNNIAICCHDGVKVSTLNL